MPNGKILKGIGGFYYVYLEDGKLVECRACGKFRLTGDKPTVGDNVFIDIGEDGSGYVRAIDSRKNILVRPSISNIDTIVVIVCEADPVTDLYLIDKVVAITEHKGIDVIICVNKCDITELKNIYNLYSAIGYTVISTSAKTLDGILELKQKLAGKISVLTGNSGVGKSSIINALFDDMNLQIGEISAKIGRGKHTTRSVELFMIDNHTFIGDTPGFSSLNIGDVAPDIHQDNLENLFIEFSKYSEECKFIGCPHISGTGCGILQAVEDGHIKTSRYSSYVKLYQELKRHDDWGRKK